MTYPTAGLMGIVNVSCGLELFQIIIKKMVRG